MSDNEVRTVTITVTSHQMREATLEVDGVFNKGEINQLSMQMKRLMMTIERERLSERSNRLMADKQADKMTADVEADRLREHNLNVIRVNFPHVIDPDELLALMETEGEIDELDVDDLQALMESEAGEGIELAPIVPEAETTDGEDDSTVITNESDEQTGEDDGREEN